ncbi:hypothetical protein GCM10022222_10670 [Amycolatopsis ultiminotia]|uniref:Uncharacterized protein n=1 Tax=Amycolatopsis ultiminotia TaxID=543629 RepID=A0ABP6V6T9_9PSEU
MKLSRVLGSLTLAGLAASGLAVLVSPASAAENAPSLTCSGSSVPGGTGASPVETTPGAPLGSPERLFAATDVPCQLGVPALDGVPGAPGGPGGSDLPGLPGLPGNGGPSVPGAPGAPAQHAGR